jgi:hypothetical protein
MSKDKNQAKIIQRLRYHDFVSQLARDPDKIPDLRIISGYLGSSTTRDHVRVYLDATLRRYIDIPVEGVAHVDDSLMTRNPLGKAVLWVHAETSITHRGACIGCEDPTTMATGEEGGGDPTTMATGEECSGLEDPLEAIVNPFGSF